MLRGLAFKGTRKVYVCVVPRLRGSTVVLTFTRRSKVYVWVSPRLYSRRDCEITEPLQLALFKNGPVFCNLAQDRHDLNTPKTVLCKLTSKSYLFWRGFEVVKPCRCETAFVTLPKQEKIEGPVSQKSRNFTGHFRVSQFPLYLKNREDLSHQTPQSFFFLLTWRHVKRSDFENKRLAVSQRLLGPETFSGFSRNGPKLSIAETKDTSYYN